MYPLVWAMLIILAALGAEGLLRLRSDPLARDLTGDWAQLPEATRRLSPRALRRTRRIVVLGDSIPFGWPLATHDGYPSRLQALLQAREPHRPLAVINAGIGGHTAAMGLARVERDLLRWRPQIVLIAFGMNDCHLARTPLDERRERRMRAALSPLGRLRVLLRQSALLALIPRPPPIRGEAPLTPDPSPRRGRGEAKATNTCQQTPPSSPPGGRGRGLGDSEGPRLSPSAYADALRALVRRARRAGAQPYLVTMTPLGPPALPDSPASPPGWDAEVYRAYDRILRRIAGEERVPLIDLQAAFPSGPALQPLLAADGVHLTAQGQQLVAQAIGDRLGAIS